MKGVLEELKGSMGGIIGSFIINENGEVAEQDMPALMSEPLGKVSKTLYHVASVLNATKPMERMAVEAETAKLILIPVNGKSLVVIVDKSINAPIFKLMSNMAVSKIKSAPATPKAPELDSNKICDLYDDLFGAAAGRLANIIGPKCASIFTDGATIVKNKYPAVFGNLNFVYDGKPDMVRIREKAAAIPKTELFNALDELLHAMLDSVKKTAGPVQEQKAREAILKIKGEHKTT